MTIRIKSLALPILTAAALILAGACASTPEEDARKIVESNKDSIVTIKIVEELTVSYEGQTEKEQQKMEASGTVIDPGGLVVTSLSEIDSSEGWGSMMPDQEGLEYSSAVVSCIIRTGSGQELPADVILRDKDLDLAFIKPKKAPESPMSYVDLTQEAKPQMLDKVAYPIRLGKLGGYAPAGYLDQIMAVLNKPRLFYAVAYGFEGCPAFALDGTPVGISVWRNDVATSDDEDADFMSIILPCSTVLKIAEQAKTAQ